MFDFPEDEMFFRTLLCDNSEDISLYVNLFDFRAPTIKRKEFNVQMPKIRNLLIKRHGKVCMLRFSSSCDVEKGLNVDHVIPLSSNKLNKELRHLAAQAGKKVQTQSFGSNHIMNLILACKPCNANKKHRFLMRQQIKEILKLKSGIDQATSAV